MLFNQRSVDEILSMILMLSSLVGVTDKGKSLVLQLKKNLLSIKETAKKFPSRPRVYFEEWDEPMISGIRWVSELVGIAGGEDVFPVKSLSPDATGRIVSSAAVIEKRPEVILCSSCGKKFRPE